jgi:hypothetical protein
VTIADETWHHVAFSRQSGSLRFFLDGEQAGPAESLENNLGATSGSIVIGYPGEQGFAGYIDELRIIRGRADFTSTFTPSEVAYIA